MNRELIKLFEEFAFFADIHDEPFKKRAYERVLESLESFGEDIGALYKTEGRAGLFKIAGVGEGIADKIEEFLKTGDVRELKKFKKKFPVDIEGLTAIEGVGPRMVKTLWEKLKIKTVADLEKAARAGKIRNLPHFGEKSEQKILKGIEFLKKASGRVILGFELSAIRALEDALRKHPLVDRAVVAGSVRRMKETIGDIDILVVSKKSEAVMDFFTGLPEVARVIARGSTKASITLTNGLDADLRVVSEESFGSALHYFTGSKDHNVAMRELAIKKKLKLNEYGLFSAKGGPAAGWRQIAGKDEEGIYKALGLSYIPPEVRENTGELEASRRGYRFDDLIDYGDVKGDLQVQTKWTDGAHSIEEMAEAAIARGLEYIAITDHTKSLAMMGLDERAMRKEMEEIDRLNEKFKKQKKKFRVLKGAEVNILKDGTLDLPDAFLKELDVVGIAVHGNFHMSRSEQTRRIIRAMENPHADILFHPTGRIIQKREPYDVDMDAIIQAARQTGTVLEIDCYPSRSDLKDEYIRKAVDAGVTLSIDSDAHHKDHFAFLEYGTGLARRGWAKKSLVINARPVEKMLKMLK